MGTEPFSLPSFAKINLYLRVLGKRSDGYTNLVTVYQSVSLADTVEFSPGVRVSFTCDDPSIPLGDDNLIVRAATALRMHCGVKIGASIRLSKRIPSQGGLGGGSSNAAVALIGLRRLWRIAVSDDELLTIAAGLGSDVPFFLAGGTALGTGRGEIIAPLQEHQESFLLIVTPSVDVSTAVAFSALDRSFLTIEESNRILQVSRTEAESLDLHRSGLINDFETSVFGSYPEIERVKSKLLELGAINAAMSGSGASVFAIFDKRDTRQAAMKALDSESTWRKFAVTTISRSEYREALSV